MKGQASLSEVVVPANLGEALAALAADPTLVPLAGGTDLLVLFNAGKLPPTRFLNLWGLPELQGIQVEAGAITLGALTTYQQVASHPLLAAECPNLVASALATGAPAIQNRGTLGGNILNASPAADTPPSLLVYDAEVELASPSGRRWLPYAEFHTGYKRTAKAPHELLTRIRLPRPQGGVHHFRKVGTRAAQAITKVSLAAHVHVTDGHLTRVRLALGAVAPAPIRARRTEALLQAQPLGALSRAAVRESLMADIAPIDDLRASAGYRRRVARNLLEAFLESLQP